MNLNSKVDLHGFYPWEADLLETIESKLCDAWEAETETVEFIHGHGFGRDNFRSLFANTNTGRLGLCVRSHLRNTGSLRRYMLAKIDVSDCGTTTVRIRRKTASNHSGPRTGPGWSYQ
ncbi:MAG: Smr/MutS family protein [Planctomycetes bacterium]|nr:Smr/MutS family protein [Planctomycetota bacterium]